MKTIIILLLSIVIIITACISTQTNTTDVVVLRDITDKYMVQPNADDILKFYDFASNEWNGGSFRFSDISQVSLNKTEYARLDEANQWFSNQFKREDEIKRFQESVQNIVFNAEQSPMGKDNSSIYLPIALELNLLSQSKAKRRIFLIYSDLMENSDNLSFYRKEDFSILKANPRQIQEQFEKLVALNPLVGIDVWFIYQPRDTKDDHDFQIVSGFYKRLLESKGARVNISANITF